MAEKRIELMVPVSQANVEESAMADRPAGMDGKVLGVLCNRKHNADILLSGLVERLSGRYDFSETVYREKQAASPTPENTLNELKEKCDIVLNAVGD